MRRYLFLLLFAALGIAFSKPVRAQSSDPSDLFLNAYMAVQQGEKLEHDGSLRQALARFRYAASLLEQIQQKYPNWQPLIVDYRKKRTSENIARIEQQSAGQAVEPEAPLPQKNASEMNSQAQEDFPQPPRGDDAATDIKSRIDQLQSDLRDSKAQLRSVQDEKAQLADQLQDALKQIDQSKVNVAELRTKLRQAQDAFNNGRSENAGPEQQAMQRQIDQLREQLAEAQADREAADAVNSDYARRIARVRKTVTTASKEQAAAAAKVKELEAKYASASKLTKQLEDAKNEIAKLNQENATSRLSSSEAAKKLVEAQKEFAAISKERDAARKQADELTKKVDDAQKQIVSVGVERDNIAKQRDQALAELAKAREAQKRVDRLIADNAALGQKLADAEKTIKQFNTDAPKKDEELANLRKEVGETKALLAATQKQNSEYRTSIADLQKQLDAANSELIAMQSSGASSEEKKKFTEENDLLRGIVLRQLKEQARREQSKKLVLAELQRLEVRSNTLMQQIDYLGQPVVKLTDQEKALFKQPQIEIAETDSSSAMEFSIAAPKPGEDIPHPIADTQLSAKSTPKPAAASSPGATPMEIAKMTTPAPAAVSTASPKPAGDSLPEKAGADAASSPQVETSTNPNVPDEMVAQAREAKDAFERSQYRDAEKAYQKMLSKAPNNVYILSNLGVVYFRESKMKLAEEMFKKAIAIAPQDSFSHRTLGIVYYQQGKYDEAVNALTRAVAINPKDAIAHNYLGIAASQKGWQEAALKELETAIALEPSYADANFNLAVVYATMRPPNKEVAHRYYKRATDLGAEPDTALEQLIK